VSLDAALLAQLFSEPLRYGNKSVIK